MYIKKSGVEWYIQRFENIMYQTKDVMRQDYSNNKTRSIKELINSRDDANPKHDADELLNHVKNSIAHMKSEENVFNNLSNQIGKGLFAKNMNVTNPLFQKLTQAISDMRKLETHFEDIEKILQLILTMSTTEPKDSPDVLMRNYNDLISHLKLVHNNCTSIANNMRDIIRSIDQEKELIVREEEVATDFYKNLMSWF
jgi:hypothetical protein